MKLRLPKKFTTAFLAACTAFSLNTAAATTGTAMFTGGTTNYYRGDMLLDMYLTRGLTTGTATSNTLNLDNAVNIYGGNFFAKDFTISIWVDSASLSNSHLLFAYGNYYDPTHDWQANGLYWDANNKALTLGDGKVTGDYTTFNFHDSNRKIATTINDMPNSGLVNITLAVHGTNTHQEGTVYVNGSATGNVMRTDDGDYYYNGNMNGDSAPIGLYVASGVTYGNITVTDQKLTDQTARYALMGLSSEKPAQSFNYVWNGEAPTAAWDTTSESWLDNGQPAQYVSNLDATAFFNTDAVAKDVSVNGDIKAAMVNVNDDYTFTIGSGQSLTVGMLAVAAGKTATVAGEGSVSLGSLSGAITIAAGATVNVTSAIMLTDSNTLPVSGEGTFGVTTLNVAGGTHTITNALNVTGGGNGEGTTNNKLGINLSGANGILNINAGITTVTGAVYSNQDGTTINVGTGDTAAMLVTGRLEMGDYYSFKNSSCSYLTIGANGTVVITSTNDASASNSPYPSKTTGLILSEWSQQTVASVAGKLYAQNVKLYHGDTAMDITIQNGGVVAVKGISQSVSFKNTNSNITLKDGGKLILGESGIVSGGGTWSITLNGGEIGMTADTTLARAMNVAGDVTFNTAKYTWSGAADTLALNEGIEGGIMTVSGNIIGEGSVTKTGEGTLALCGGENNIGGNVDIQNGSVMLAESGVLQAGRIILEQNGKVEVQNKIEMGFISTQDAAVLADVTIDYEELRGVGGKGTLENVSMKTSANYTIENMCISGSLIDVSEGTRLYLVNVDIHPNTHITDEAAWLDMKATKGWLDKDNTQVVREYTTEQDTTLFKSGDTRRSITLAAGTEIVELTSDMFDTVTLTGTDLWLDMTGIAKATYNKDYFTLDFKNLTHSLKNAQVDVDHLHVYATLDGERYTEAYSTAKGGLTTTLYFQVPEPATSTLSLLALAALAARRRRK